VPEGDTVFLVAKRFATAMTGKTLLRGEFRVPQLATRGTKKPPHPNEGGGGFSVFD